MQGSNPTQNGE